MTGGMPGPPGGPRPMMGPGPAASRPPSMSGAAPGMGPTYTGAPAPSRPGLMPPARPGLMPPPRLGSMQPGVLQPGAHLVPGCMGCDMRSPPARHACRPAVLHASAEWQGELHSRHCTGRGTPHPVQWFLMRQYTGKCRCRLERIVCWQVMLAGYAVRMNVIIMHIASRDALRLGSML